MVLVNQLLHPRRVASLLSRRSSSSSSFAVAKTAELSSYRRQQQRQQQPLICINNISITHQIRRRWYSAEQRKNDHKHCVEMVQTRDFEGYCKLLLCFFIYINITCDTVFNLWSSLFKHFRLQINI